jgi:exodeoxyribonuclease V alpha subunit
MKAVITPVSTSAYTMLTRGLTYTAVTRAEELCVLVGEKKALAIAIDQVDMKKRNSSLVQRITDPSLSGELF